jgi:acetyl esterase/lipase
MDSTLILVKTSKGIDEVKSRAFGLPQHLRALLIMADGSTSLSALLNRTAQMPQAHDDIAWLVREGFVESVSSGSRRPASSGGPATGAMPPKQMLVAMTRELLGSDAPKVLQRLQEAGESVVELGAAVERCHKFIKLTIDENKAQQFLKTGQSLLAEFK